MMEEKLTERITVGDLIDAMDETGFMERYGDTQIGGNLTVGEIVDAVAGNADAQARRDEQITVNTTVGSLLDIVGEDNVKTFLEQKTAEANYQADYEYNAENVIGYWMHLLLFILVFAALATITLEFIDKDKR